MIQGCYSGGFIEDPRKENNEELLSSLKNITVLTASRYDRESFGCQPGAQTTFYGGAFNEVLQKEARSPLEISWKQIHQNVRKKVKKLEEGEKLISPSLPQYFSSKAPHLTEDN